MSGNAGCRTRNEGIAQAPNSRTRRRDGRDALLQCPRWSFVTPGRPGSAASTRFVRRGRRQTCGAIPQLCCRRSEQTRDHFPLWLETSAGAVEPAHLLVDPYECKNALGEEDIQSRLQRRHLPTARLRRGYTYLPLRRNGRSSDIRLSSDRRSPPASHLLLRLRSHRSRNANPRPWPLPMPSSRPRASEAISRSDVAVLHLALEYAGNVPRHDLPLNCEISLIGRVQFPAHLLMQRRQRVEGN